VTVFSTPRHAAHQWLRVVVAELFGEGGGASEA